jgi:prevent-host-death family protein
MKRPALKEDLVPVADFRTNLAKYLDQVAEGGRPVVVTSRGRAAGVLVSPDALDEIEAERELVQKVLAGLRDVEAGNLVDEDEVWADIEDIIVTAEKRKKKR